ncbi:hypothetical protein Tco_0449391 [Tanacetum coccineum]
MSTAHQANQAKKRQRARCPIANTNKLVKKWRKTNEGRNNDEVTASGSAVANPIMALTKPKKSGRVAKWEIELGEQDIVFQKRGDDKKETSKDFLIKVPLEDSRKEAEGRTDTKSKNTKLSCEWELYTDGTQALTA